MALKKLPLFLIFITVISALAPAYESQDGRIRFALHEKSGFFSLYYMTDPSERKYEPFFNARDPSTNFMAVEADGKVYRLGESRSFTTISTLIGDNPAFVHESSFLRITQVFSLLKTPNSMSANGIKVSIKVENTSVKETSVALRVLFDTILGEGINKAPFIVEGEPVKGELIIRKDAEKKYWVTRDKKLSFMGSIEIPDERDGRSPDFIHFANWKKLNDANWKALYYEGRSFNYTPYSTGDSALCYYYEPYKLNPGESFQTAIYLSTEDKDGFLEHPAPAPVTGSAIVKSSDIDSDVFDQMMIMRKCLETLDRFIAGEIILSDNELSEIDFLLNDIKERNNIN